MPLSAAVVASLAIACAGSAEDGTPSAKKDGGRPAVEKPPDATLRAGGLSQSGTLGSYTWKTVQADAFGVYVSDDAISVRRGEEVEFHIGGSPPSQVSLIVYEPRSPPSESSNGIVGWLFGPEAMNLATVARDDLQAQNEPAYRLDLPPGTYLLSLLVSWDEGQAGYGFHVNVTE